MLHLTHLLKVVAPILLSSVLTLGVLLSVQLAPRAQAAPTAGEVCFATLDGTTVYSSIDAQAVRAALAVAGAGSTVKVAGTCAGVATQNGSTQVALVNKTLTLAGGYTTTNWSTYNPVANPTTLDALGGGRVISASVAATLQGFTVKNGVSTWRGGGIYAGAALTLTGMKVYSNTASDNGGGMLATGAATLSGTLFQNNQSTTRLGGGLYAFNTVALTNTQFLSNTSNGSGGGVLVNGAVTLSGGLFQNNQTNGANGGGLYAVGPATLSGGLFLNNRSLPGAGGGLYVNSTLALTDTQFLNNTAGTSGGGVYLTTANAKRLVNVLLAGNTAGSGAAVFVANANPLEIIHTTIARPTVSGVSAVYVALGTVYLTNTIIASHTVGLEQAGGTVGENYNLFSDVSTPYNGAVTSGGNSITGAAAFYDTASYTLTASSAAIDRGLNLGYSPDYFGAVRPYPSASPRVDIGYAESPFLGGTCYATPNNGATVYGSFDAQAVRDALAAANAGGTVKVAGTCAGVLTESGSTQVALVNKTLTVAGGYTTTNWTTYNPSGNPTTLDALGGGRVIRASVAATLQGFTVTNGVITGDGGGIYASSPLTLTEMRVYSNTASGYGGGAYVISPAQISDTLFQNNKSTGGVGGGLCAFSTYYTLTLTNTQFLNNTAYAPGGGVYVEGPAQVSGGLFRDNQSTASRGGGLYAEGYGTLTLSGTQFINNVAYDSGGGMRVNGVATVSGALFQFNRTTTAAPGDGGGLYVGTGMYVGAAITLINTQFSNNTSAHNGGGAYTEGPAQVSGSIFQDNSNSFSGGGLYAADTLTLTGTQFLRNTASFYGGGAYAAGAAQVSGGLFQNNRSTGSSGGGLYAFTTLNLTGATQFLNNSASGNGGGAYAVGAAQVSGGLFQNNQGGGVYANTTLTLTDTQFLGNTGRGAYAGGTAQVSGGLFQNNRGGGLHAASTLALTGTQFLSNTVAGNGGGVYLATANAKRLVNVLLAGNTATGSGAAVYVADAGPLEIIHTTIASPTLVSKQAVYVVSGTVYLTNTLIASHTLGLERAGGTVRENYNLFSGVSTPYSGTITSGGNSITGAADFVDPANGDYHLSVDSAAIDVGANAGVTTDFDAQARPLGTGYDPGYDEVSKYCLSGGNLLANTPYTFGSPAITITFSNLGNINCVLGAYFSRGHTQATGVTGHGVGADHFWQIVARDNIGGVATGFTAIMTASAPVGFTGPQLCFYSGGGGYGWDCGGTANGDGTLSRSGLTHFSDWAVGGQVGPTAVTLNDLSAAGTPIGREGPLGLLVAVAGLIASASLIVWRRRQGW